ncbi:reverse transcriptase [Gossypium australe]|uniref:Reverse transcriptase n=1 Tax=Gossypium australe TaxID=47621 RepID=A0A5B6V881_9ROSI|nr:reverse transcriptase [Gossypium australe]
MNWKVKWLNFGGKKENGRLGFHSLTKFNVTLLVKQGWRIINYPNSLLSRVLKAKYFPNTDFLNTELGNLPFYTWKSVWAGKGFLHEEMCWRVGTREKFSIMAYAWLLGAACCN